MSNPYAPPNARVEDPQPPKRGSWLRTIGLIAGFALLSLLLGWVVAPSLAQVLTDGDFAQPTTPLLVFDLALSCAASYVCCLMAARLSQGRAVIAAFGVGAIGCAFYLIQVGGFDGMLPGDFPLWYEYFPANLVSAWLASVVATRADSP